MDNRTEPTDHAHSTPLRYAVALAVLYVLTAWEWCTSRCTGPIVQEVEW